jgi:hypothetical protein
MEPPNTRASVRADLSRKIDVEGVDFPDPIQREPEPDCPNPVPVRDGGRRP